MSAILFIFGMVFAQGAWAARTPNDVLFNTQWYLPQIHAPEAWEQITGSPQVIVAIIDTGVDLDHPDLQGRVWVNSKEVPGDEIDNEKNGYVDDVNGWDFIGNDGSPIPFDSPSSSYDEGAISHGTLIAGVIGAATNNKIGVAGINWNVKIMPIRILDELGSGGSDYAAKAIDYAVKNGAQVINLSFTGIDFDATFRDAIRRAYEHNVLVVAAVGNSDNGGMNINNTPIYPACFIENSVHFVLGVGATEHQDKKADFSNYGSTCTDISAPGVDIYGLLYEFPEEGFTEAYGGYWEGTSVAAPMVSGAAALLVSEYPTITPAQIRTILQLSADPIVDKGTKTTGQMGTGRLNLARAFEVAAQFFPAGSTPSPHTSGQITGSFLFSQVSGSPPMVFRTDLKGIIQNQFSAYDASFRGDVRIATGDLDGDGKDEIVTAPGPGNSPRIHVFKQDGTPLAEFLVDIETNRTGIFVAIGDVDGNGRKEIVTTIHRPTTSLVDVFTETGSLISSWTIFGQNDIRVTTGDIDGDGTDEIITATGFDSSPMVTVWKKGKVFQTFTAYAPTFTRGIFVTTGDMDADGNAEIITGTDEGGGPQVRLFRPDGSVVSSFFAYDSAFRGGVRVTTGDIDGDGKKEIITVPGPGGGPHVRVFDLQGKERLAFFPFSKESHTGLNVAFIRN